MFRNFLDRHNSVRAIHFRQNPSSPTHAKYAYLFYVLKWHGSYYLYLLYECITRTYYTYLIYIPIVGTAVVPIVGIAVVPIVGTAVVHIVATEVVPH